MTLKRAIIAYLPHKRMENTGNKKIIFFDIMKPLKGVRPTPNKTANQNTKKGLISWKTKTKQAIKIITMLH
ncbi:type I restriction endonuclease [Helicobacter pylori]|nr:type I restriction endonuclease [Helicobacter pylori]